MIKKFLIVSMIAAVCSAELVPVSSYVGKHKYKCEHGSAITGARIDDKLYTFGGCYPIPYIVDPNDDDFGMRYHNIQDHMNTSSSIEVYDIPTNQWTIETDVQTPYPWKKASLQTYKHNIFFHNIRTKRHERYGRTMWKYDTMEKKWTRLADLPFVWIGTLGSCQANGKIYFSGTDDGQIRTIIQVYNVETDNWETPIFPDKTVMRMRQMLCGKDQIYFLGVEKNEQEEDENSSAIFYTGMHGNGFHESFDLISIDYNTGHTLSHGVNITANFDKVSVKDDSFYILGVDPKNSTIYKVDTITQKQTTLGTFPHTLQNPLLIPYENDEIFLFGGGDERRGMGCNSGSGFDYEFENSYHCNTLKTYNHKLVPDLNEPKLVLQK